MIDKKDENRKFYTSDYSRSKYSATAGNISHYTSADGAIGILTNMELWLTNIYFLNDNQEMFYTYKLIKKEVLPAIKEQIDENFAKTISNYIEYLLSEEYFKEESKTLARNDFYIASFSLEEDNLSLWNYYTKTGATGYSLTFKDYMFMDHAVAQGKVCYNADEQKQMLINTILKYNTDYQNSQSEVKKGDVAKELIYNFKIYSLFFKAKKYEIEKEYRIIMTILTSTSEEEKECWYRQKNGLIIPYIKLDLKKLQENYQEYDFIIDKITISPLNNGEITRYGIRRLTDCAGLYNCEIVFSEADMKY